MAILAMSILMVVFVVFLMLSYCFPKVFAFELLAGISIIVNGILYLVAFMPDYWYIGICMLPFIGIALWLKWKYKM